MLIDICPVIRDLLRYHSCTPQISSYANQKISFLQPCAVCLSVLGWSDALYLIQGNLTILYVFYRNEPFTFL